MSDVVPTGRLQSPPPMNSGSLQLPLGPPVLLVHGELLVPLEDVVYHLLSLEIVPADDKQSVSQLPD